MDDKKAAALALAGMGFRVFPIRADGDARNQKRPAVDNWQGFATSDLAAVERRWAGQYAGCNIGVATGRGLLVLDFDCKDGKRGLESLALLELIGLPAGRRVRTPTGGLHVYLHTPPDAGITIMQEFYPGVDVRCDGGYVLGPGSAIDGVRYEWC